MGAGVIGVVLQHHLRESRGKQPSHRPLARRGPGFKPESATGSTHQALAASAISGRRAPSPRGPCRAARFAAGIRPVTPRAQWPRGPGRLVPLASGAQGEVRRIGRFGGRFIARNTNPDSICPVACTTGWDATPAFAPRPALPSAGLRASRNAGHSRLFTTCTSRFDRHGERLLQQRLGLLHLADVLIRGREQIQVVPMCQSNAGANLLAGEVVALEFVGRLEFARSLR